ncbi:hypothetical protein L7F22_060903, partial [Adiantum nelumboides]|nr:hypothetical protein [Adiantum nelumboides]
CEADIMSMVTKPKRRKIVQGAKDSRATYKRISRPSKRANFKRSMAREGTQEYSQVSQKDVEDVEENGGVEELVDNIVHDLEQENLEKVVNQVAIERKEQEADIQRTQEDDRMRRW